MAIATGSHAQKSYLAIKRIQNFSSKSPVSSTKKIHHDSHASIQVLKQNKPIMPLNSKCAPQQSSQKKRIINLENQLGPKILTEQEMANSAVNSALERQHTPHLVNYQDSLFEAPMSHSQLQTLSYGHSKKNSMSTPCFDLERAERCQFFAK